MRRANPTSTAPGARPHSLSPTIRSDRLATGIDVKENAGVRADVETLRSRGVRFLEPAPEGYPFGVRVTALDPDGNRVSLRQQRR